MLKTVSRSDLIYLPTAVFIENRNVSYRNTNEMRLCIYAFVLIAFMFAAIMGTVYSPSELAVTYMALIIAAPLAFVDKPRYFVCLSTISYVIHILSVLMPTVFMN